MRHRAEVLRRGRGPRATVAVPKSGGQSFRATVRRTVGVDDSQADVTIGRRLRCARRAGRGHRRTESLMRDDALHFDVGEASEGGVPLFADLDDGGLAVSSNRGNDLGSSAGQHHDARVGRYIRRVEHDPDAIGSLDCDEIDDSGTTKPALRTIARYSSAVRCTSIGCRNSARMIQEWM